MNRFKTGKYLVLVYKFKKCIPCIIEFSTFSELRKFIGFHITTKQLKGLKTQKQLVDEVRKLKEGAEFSNELFQTEVYYIKPNNDLVPFLV